MNFSRLIQATLLIVGFFVGCSTDPEIDWDRLEERTLVTCVLRATPRGDDDIIDQRVIIQTLRPLVGYAFDPELEQTFGVPDARVTMSDHDSTYIFQDEGNGSYLWEGEEHFVKHGGWYRLDIDLPDGRQAWSEVAVPKIFFEDISDTIWIRPDSITDWTDFPPETSIMNQPIAAEGPHYRHTIRFQLTPEAELYAPFEEIKYDPGRIPGVWTRFEKTDSSLFIFTAVDTPFIFLEDFEPIYVTIGFATHHKLNDYYSNLDEDDHWPVDDLEEMSNIMGPGIYGYLVPPTYCVDREFLVLLRSDE